jgi:hypothetical protein
MGKIHWALKKDPGGRRMFPLACLILLEGSTGCHSEVKRTLADELIWGGNVETSVRRVIAGIHNVDIIM